MWYENIYRVCFGLDGARHLLCCTSRLKEAFPSLCAVNYCAYSTTLGYRKTRANIEMLELQMQ